MRPTTLEKYRQVRELVQGGASTLAACQVVGMDHRYYFRARYKAEKVQTLASLRADMKHLLKENARLRKQLTARKGKE